MFRTYKQFMEAGLNNDESAALHKIADEKVFGFGTAVDEKIFGIKEIKKLLKNQKKQSKGLDIKWKSKPVSRYITTDENSAVFADDLHLSIRAGKETVKMYMRISMVLNYSNGQWKVIHWHGSKPEQVESEKDTWGVENWKQKATELVRLVDEKTADLIGKNRELEIETALERTRTRSLLMQHSDELLDISKVFHEQLLLLGIDSAFSFVWLPNEEKGDHLFWATWLEEKGSNKQFQTRAITYPLDMTEPYTAACFVDWKSGVFVHEHFVAPENMDTFFASWAELLEGAERLKPAFFPDGIYYTEAFMKYGCFGIDIRRPLSPKEKEILHRFAIEFERSYTRFLDLQKAEAQAREAQIEAALERVRSRTMAMHKSEELLDVINVVSEQMQLVGIRFGFVCFGMIDSYGNLDFWMAAPQAGEPEKIHMPFIDNPLTTTLLEAKQKGQRLLVNLFSREEMMEWSNVFFDNNPSSKIMAVARPFILESPGLVRTTVILKDINVFAGRFTDKPFSEEQNAVIVRFATVFEQSYTRFLDLQKAEAQAREAQIEAALERVRAKAMAMHSSQDLADTIGVFYKELQSFSITPRRCGVGLLKKENKVGEIFTWNTTEKGESLELVGKLQMTGHPILEQVYEHWLTQTDYYPVLKGGDEIKKYYRVLRPQMNFPDYDSDVIQYGYFFMFNEGGVYAWTDHEMNEAELQIYRRFKSVLSLTYKRYYDLQMAEAQAREATIETALEKVRGKAMAMHSSSDLSATASVVFTELRKLGVNPVRCGVGLLSKENRKAQLYATTVSEKGDEMSLLGWALLEGNPVLAAQYDKWLLQEDYYPVLKGEALKEYSQSISTNFRLPDISSDYTQYGCFLPFSEGFLYAWSEQPFGDADKRIMQRFKAIIDLTFRRYLELQQSEANALEAVRRASLDRVRAEIASMRTTEDLQRIIPLVWNELTILGIPFIRCGVFIMDDPRQLIHTFLSTPDGKAIGSFHLPYDTPGKIAQVLQHWRDKKGYFDHWDKNAFVEFANVLVGQGALTSPDQYLSSIPDSGFHLHFLPFLQGMLYVGNTNLLGEQDIRLIQSVAEAFATAYARYEDFNKLEVAKKQVDETLNELQATQKQLIQSEKMASLGELTAGIAHEIQNPLNFVNNFSEVSKELLGEMKEALELGDTEDAKNIMNDVIQNLEKINHHGKRADGIVKGMLQHSRSSSGQKEPTDVNALCDEYLRLAYHGLRAKDKSFNAKFETNFDENIGKINVMPQEIGRVVLNLINNAFYAVSERKNKGETNYEPTVIITTKKEAEKVLISVKDNGNGIPASIKEKIFQPFFTTKPTGQGTGLGLSLSYDIVKAHGGELKVKTNEGEGTELIIQLPNNKA